MERRQGIPGAGRRHVGAFLATCALHAVTIYWLGTLAVTRHDPLWSSLEVSFVPSEKAEPPPSLVIPTLMSDAFAERPLIDIPPPTIELGAENEASAAIHVPPPPEPHEESDTASDTEQGYGPLTKPRVRSGPTNPQDRYPRASIRHKESGRTVVKLCISTTGIVQSVEVAESSGYRRLDEAAIDMGWDYVFEPALRDGKPVAVCLPYGINFRMSVGGMRRGR